MSSLEGLAAGDVEAQEAAADLVWLREHGALAGIAEIMRERRRQIEQGRTAGDDDVLAVDMALGDLNLAQGARAEGTADVGSDESYLREAGALVAAEIDRLERILTPEGAGSETRPLPETPAPVRVTIVPWDPDTDMAVIYRDGVLDWQDSIDRIGQWFCHYAPQGVPVILEVRDE